LISHDISKFNQELIQAKLEDKNDDQDLQIDEFGNSPLHFACYFGEK